MLDQRLETRPEKDNIEALFLIVPPVCSFCGISLAFPFVVIVVLSVVLLDEPDISLDKGWNAPSVVEVLCFISEVEGSCMFEESIIRLLDDIRPELGGVATLQT